MTQVAELLLEEGRQKGRQEGISLSGEIFRKIKINPAYENEQISRELNCTVKEVEDVRRLFGI